MRVTKINTDYVIVDESNIRDKKLKEISRIHLIKFAFFEPSAEKINEVLSVFPETNRFVIQNNIGFYNSILKHVSKKYYVENSKNDGLISFFRKNNKVLLNTLVLNIFEREFVFKVSFLDILRNIEVIQLSRQDFKNNFNILNKWNGNCIVC